MAGKKRGPARRKRPAGARKPAGTRGPVPQPAEVVALRNRAGTVNRRADAGVQVVPAEELPVLDMGAPPGAMTAQQRRWWDILGATLSSSKVLRVTDSAALLLLARNLGWMEDLHGRIGEDTMVVVDTGKDVAVQPNPFLLLYLRLQTEVVRAMREFGLTPAARGRILADVASGQKDMSIATWMTRKDDY